MGFNWFLGSDTSVVVGWIGNLVAIPRRRAGLRLRMRKRALIEKLDEIFREKNVQRPIDRDAAFLFRPRQFAPVNSAPEKPGKKSGKVQAENPRDACAAADRGKQPERFES